MKTNYTPAGEIITPFNGDERGLAALDDINGLNQKNARTWQVIALVSLTAFFLALAMLFFAIRMPKTVPVIVTVNADGEASYVGRVNSASYNNTRIPEIAKEYQIKNLITRMFTRVIDSDAQNMYIQEAGAAVQDGAGQLLDTFFRQNNPFENFGDYTASVDIDPPLKQSDRTYIVYFTVTTRTAAGYAAGKKRYSILVTLGYYKISQQNPLGIYITNFDLKEVSLPAEDSKGE